MPARAAADRVDSCRTCAFWRPQRPGGEGWGQCRRMPPALPEVHEDRLALVGVWPITDARDWCGEWRPADGVVPEDVPT